MTAFNYRAAETCAKYKMILDLHGTHKPAGLNRTYPNVLNFRRGKRTGADEVEPGFTRSGEI